MGATGRESAQRLPEQGEDGGQRSRRRPRLGIVDAEGVGVDLRDCALHEQPLVDALPVLADFIARAGLEPYDIARRVGELKHLVVTASPAGELMIRFVLRSQESVTRIRKHLDLLTTRLAARVVTVNLLPEHRAVTEGEQEIVLTDDSALPMRVNDIELDLRPQSFFQTNTTVAAQLYATARAWADSASPASVWDLFSGVGGFAFHLASPQRVVTGVEISAAAVDSARHSAARAASAPPRFLAGDATDLDALPELTGGGVADLVVVNPPRRGIGGLAGQLERSGVRSVLYSSCNPTSLERDLIAMPSLRPTRARLFDMFPHTSHCEILALLERV